MAYINNHSFLDNPTFRGMRYNLMQTFDKIYILDLHGNAKKKETAPDGSKDENVFDIQQGVSINIFVKTGLKKKDELAKVFHRNLYGKRSEKYKFLLNNNLQIIKLNELKLTAPQYFFVTKDFSLQKEYKNGFSVKEMFPVNSLGLITKRDNLTISYSKKELINKMSFFLDENNSIQDVCNHFAISVKDKDRWNALVSRKNTNVQEVKKQIKDILYRPFDIRKVFYNEYFIARLNKKVLDNLQNTNYAVIIGRQGQVVGEVGGWNIIFITDSLVDQNIFYRGGGTVFPLYLYPDNNLMNDEQRQPNFNETIINNITSRLGLTYTEEKENIKNTFSPIDILDYIYAVLHSPSYREKYKEFLKIDFPRIPYPENTKQFEKLAAFGEKLRKLHLLENITVPNNFANYPKTGSNKVENSFTEKSGNYRNNEVWINDTQYFDHVPETVWKFYIGGYQPAQKWLKDRKERLLSYEDIEHYQKIIFVLNETDKIMKKIDKIPF
ncbi:MAG: hypothetical protein LBJ00_05805 [Planctomycetaceae bacterium]|nr:hypothetical protein [Planctomycetaceae bacterium]